MITKKRMAVVLSVFLVLFGINRCIAINEDAHVHRAKPKVTYYDNTDTTVIDKHKEQPIPKIDIGSKIKQADALIEEGRIEEAIVILKEVVAEKKARAVLLDQRQQVIDEEREDLAYKVSLHRADIERANAYTKAIDRLLDKAEKTLEVE